MRLKHMSYITRELKFQKKNRIAETVKVSTIMCDQTL